MDTLPTEICTLMWVPGYVRPRLDLAMLFWIGWSTLVLLGGHTDSFLALGCDFSCFVAEPNLVFSD